MPDTLRRRLIEELGLPDDADDEAIKGEVNRIIDKADEKTVNAAISAGKISANSRAFWAKSLKHDRAGTRQVLAAMKPTHTPVNQKSSSAPAPIRDWDKERTTPVVLNGRGEVIQEQVEYGRPPSEWSKKEVDDAGLWALGPDFRNGLEPPPEHGQYIRDLTQPHMVQNPDGTSRWEQADPYGT